MIKRLRIDDRLMHAQVVMNWSKHLSIGGILIVSDEVASSSMRQMAVKVSKPSDMKLFIKSVKDAIGVVDKLNGFSYNSMIVVENVPDALALVKNCPCLLDVTVTAGGQKMGEGRRLVSDLLCLSDEDIRMLQEIEALGGKVEIRKLPEDSPKRISDII